MSSNIEYKVIKVIETDGASFETRSTYKHSELHLSVDTKNHPAWTKSKDYVDTTNNEVAKFNKKFSGIDFKGLL